MIKGLVLACVAVSAVGCGAYMDAMNTLAAASDVEAENPLKGKPLAATSKSDVFAQGEKDCTIWPLEDKMELRATEAEICVSMTTLKESPSETWVGEPTANRTEFVQVSTDTAKAPVSISVEKGTASKIGQCRGKSVWSFSYEGCAANEGALTDKSAWLSAEGNRWKFPGDSAVPGVPGGLPNPTASLPGASLVP
jgi:hypothetical protein